MKWIGIALSIAVSLTCLTGCPPSSLNSIVIYNQSYKVAVNVFLSSSASDDWGYDQLPGLLYPGESFLLHSIPDGVYDLLVYADDNSYWDAYGISLYGGQQRTFNLVSTKLEAADNALEEAAEESAINPQLEQEWNSPLPEGIKEFQEPQFKNK